MKESKNPARQEPGARSGRRSQEAQQAAQSKKKARIYWAIGIVVAVLVAALLIWDNGIIQRNTAAYKVGSYSFSLTDVDYYYFNQYNQIAPYASFYGLDTSKSLDEQEYEEGKSWKEFLMEQAKETMQEVALLCTEAQSNGYTLSDEGKQTVESNYNSMAEAAKNYNLTEATYLNYVYGRFMTPSAYKKAMTQQQLAAEYAQQLTDGYDISTDDMQTYYEEHAAEMDTFDFDAYYVSLGLTAEYDDEGNQKDYDATELANAQSAAKEKAEALKSVLATGTQEEIDAKATELGLSNMNGIGTSSLSYYPFGEWITDSSRTVGESDIVESTANNSSGESYVDGYYVVRFNSRTLEEYKGVNFYNLLIQAETVEQPTEETADEAAEDSAETAATDTEYNWDAAKEKIEALQEQWLSGGGTAEGFLAMAKENTDGSTTEYTNVNRDTQNTEVNEWLFGSEHQAGDYAIIQDETLHGYRLVYFTGYDELYYWQTTARNAIADERYQQWLEDSKANLEIVETSSMQQAG